jgi:hypothetical protein
MSQLAAPPSQDSFRAPRTIFWTAFLVRVAYITLAHTYRITPYNHHFEFGWETGRVAASVAREHGYSSPFSGDTGPTAWMVPGFTLLLAGVFKLFGIYSALSAWVAAQWAREYPAHFWKLVALRFYMFWASVPHTACGHPVAENIREIAHCFGSITGILGLFLALRRKLPAAGLFAWAVVLLPFVYYFIIAGSRFRNPLEPIFAVLTVYLFSRRSGAGGSRCRACGGFGRGSGIAQFPVQIDLSHRKPVHYTSLAIPACRRGERRSPAV